MKTLSSDFRLASVGIEDILTNPIELPGENQSKGGMAMKEFFKKAFPKSRRVDATKNSGSWEKKFEDSLAEGYGMNYIDSIGVGGMF